MEEVSRKTQMVKIRGFEKGFMATHLINIGAKVGLFQKLTEAKEEGLKVSDLANELGLHEPYVKLWCQTAYHFEILDCDGEGRFKLQPFLDEIRGDTNHARNYLAAIALDVDITGKGMVDFPNYFQTARIGDSYSPEGSKAAYEASKNFYLAFLYSIFPKKEHLMQLLEGGIKVLDIGCGNATLIIQFAQAFAGSRYDGVNPDIHGIEAARATISHLGLQDRVAVEHMGAENLTYKDEFDMVCMVVTLHEIPLDIREEVVEKAYQAMKSGGYLMILDFPYPSKLEDFRNPNYDYGILDQFYEMCSGTVHLTAQEQEEILTKAGFKGIEREPIGEGAFEFVSATK